MAPLRAFFVFNTLGRRAVDHAQDPAPLLGLGHDHLDRVRGGTVQIHDLRHILDAAER